MQAISEEGEYGQLIVGQYFNSLFRSTKSPPFYNALTHPFSDVLFDYMKKADVDEFVLCLTDKKDTKRREFFAHLLRVAVPSIGEDKVLEILSSTAYRAENVPEVEFFRYLVAFLRAIHIHVPEGGGTIGVKRWITNLFFANETGKEDSPYRIYSGVISNIFPCMKTLLCDGMFHPYKNDGGRTEVLSNLAKEVIEGISQSDLDDLFQIEMVYTQDSWDFGSHWEEIE